MGELYKLTLANGKSYIGIASWTVRRRFLVHIRSSKTSGTPLYRAWRKYGEPTLKVLAIIEDSLLHETEIRAIAAYRTRTPDGYNCTAGGEGSLGLRPSLETRAKLSLAKKGKPGKPRTQATRDKIAAANTGRVISEETRARLSRASSNRSPETLAKLRAASLGGLRSPELRARISATLKLRWAKTRMTQPADGGASFEPN